MAESLAGLARVLGLRGSVAAAQGLDLLADGAEDGLDNSAEEQESHDRNDCDEREDESVFSQALTRLTSTPAELAHVGPFQNECVRRKYSDASLAESTPGPRAAI